VKRIILICVPILLIALLAGCSSDIDSPSFTMYKKLNSPVSLVASYDISVDKVNISWGMPDTSGVVDFFLTLSDSSKIDAGQYFKSIPMGIDVSSQPYSYLFDTSVYIPASVDSLIMYFTISPVYQNSVFNSFIGPRAVSDSAMVKR